MGSHLVQRTVNTPRPSVEHLGVDHRRFDIAMAQQLLDGSNIIAAFEHVGRKRMPERVACGSFREPCLHDEREMVPGTFSVFLLGLSFRVQRFADPSVVYEFVEPFDWC